MNIVFLNSCQKTIFSKDNLLIVQNIESGEWEYAVEAHEEKITQLILSPDEKWLLSCSDNETKCWKTATQDQSALLLQWGSPTKNMQQQKPVEKRSLPKKAAVQQIDIPEEEQKKLIATIYSSRNNANLSEEASAAITTLCSAGYCFSGLDLSNISIHCANLSKGIFDSADFSGSNLSGVNFCDAFLKNAIFDQCEMGGVLFGECFSLPPQSGKVSQLSLSRCETELATLDSSQIGIHFWDVASAEIIALVSLYPDRITHFYFRNPRIFALCTNGDTVRLFQKEGPHLSQIKEIKTENLAHGNALALSPDISCIAVIGKETVCLHDTQQGKLQHCFPFPKQVKPNYIEILSDNRSVFFSENVKKSGFVWHPDLPL